MKQVLALLLICLLTLAACVPQNANKSQSQQSTEQQSAVSIPEEKYSGLNDPALLQHLEDSLYTDLLAELGEDYYIENVEAIYISKEYVDELAYNSQENIYFGYTLSELEEQFQGTKYIFTLSEDGQTTVKAFEAYDDTYEKIVKNVAIGAGVILLCVTISVVSGGAGAPAACMIFAASAKAGAIGALTGATFSGVTAGIVTGIQTNDFDQAKKAAALSASEGFKWGAITGAVAGGATTAIALKGATLNGLTMNQAAKIQQESKWSLNTIKRIKSVEEYNVYKEAGLKEITVKVITENGKPAKEITALVREINWNQVDEAGLTNAQRVASGKAPLDPTGASYELHHINQQSDSTLAILTNAEHSGNYSILNTAGKSSEINRPEFAKVRSDFWSAYFKQAQGGL
jgi:hypothetical protein